MSHRLAVPKYFSPIFFVNFEIYNLATYNFFKGMDKVVFGKARIGEPLAGLG
jgi:hypothetical protein